MQRSEFNKKYSEEYKKATTNRRRATLNKMFELYKENPQESWESLENAANGKEVNSDEIVGKLDNIADNEILTSKNLDGFFDENSPFYWQNYDHDQLKDLGIKAGYVSKLPIDPTEEEKQKQREEFGKFLNAIGNKDLQRTRKNIADEQKEKSFANFENVDDLRDALANLFYGNTAERMREKAMRGEDTDWGDYATIGGDILKNTLYSISPGSGNALNAALMNFGTGAAGGAVDALTTDLATDLDLSLKDYLSSIGASGAISTVGGQKSFKDVGDWVKGKAAGTKDNVFKSLGEWLEDVGLKIGGSDVDLAKHGKVLGAIGNAASKKPVANAAKYAVYPVAKDAATSKAIASVGSYEKGPKEFARDFEDLKNRKPNAVKLVLQGMSDYSLPVDEQLTEEEQNIIREHKKNSLNKLFAGDGE